VKCSMRRVISAVQIRESAADNTLAFTEIGRDSDRDVASSATGMDVAFTESVFEGSTLDSDTSNSVVVTKL
jgi:hypothetical protein